MQTTYTEEGWQKLRSTLSDREIRHALEYRSRLPADSPAISELSADEFIVRFHLGLKTRYEIFSSGMSDTRNRFLVVFVGAIVLAILGHLLHWPILIPAASWAVAALFLIKIVRNIVDGGKIESGTDKIGTEANQTFIQAQLKEISSLAEDRRRIRQLGG